MHYSHINDLVNLPYFELGSHTRLVLKKSAVNYPIIDSHTHLGWHYLFTKPLDLWKKSCIQHFFPQDNPFELDSYASVNFTTKAKRVCRFEMMRSVYNTDGYSSTHTIPNIMQEMDDLQISRSVLLALDFPVFSKNSQEMLNSVNRTKESKKRLSVYISVHPFTLNKEKLIQKWIEEGAVGIKLHTQLQFFRASDRGAFEIYALAQKYNLPILFHTGLSPVAPRWQAWFVQIKDYEIAIKTFPKVIFILGHAGGIEGHTDAVRLVNTYDNTHIETSSQSYTVLKYLIRKVDTRKIIYGSDWPFYPMAISLAKILIATEHNRAVRKDILFKNPMRLLERKNTHII
ncbi:MAG: amidohydrolase family protein [Patescibacteria group bacterium]